MSWSTLSEDVWLHIFIHVPLAQRLGSCSRVNKTLHRAAAAATQQIQLFPGESEARVQGLLGMCDWMLHHGQHLTSLQLSVRDGTLTQLPCPNLRELDMANMRVQLSASSTQPGVLHSCTRLTRLLLVFCPLTEGHNSLAALSALTGLQHLSLTMDSSQETISESTDDSFLPSTVLQHLTQLTHLWLQRAGRLLNTDSLQHASCLVNLRELHITSRSSTVPLSLNTTPGLSRLSALQNVSLQGVTFDPSILQDCTQLQGLELRHLAIISTGGAAALHSLVGRLQQLHCLQLVNLEYDWPVAAAAYTSLTASSALQNLRLTVDDLPADVWTHVFPSERQLPALQQVALSWYNADVSHPPPATALGTHDISRLASCCPGLHTISIDVQPDAQVAALAKASGLTGLSVFELHAEGFESLKALSGLVSLQELTVTLGGPITPKDLLCLTALTGLTKLSIDVGTAPNFEGSGDVTLDVTQDCHPQMQRGPPVWLQLLEHCGRFSECQPLIFNSMGQQLASQQERHTQQEQQLAAQQQQIAELQTQLANTRKQAAAEAAAAGAVAAEAGDLRGPVQALEGQMRQVLQAMQQLLQAADTNRAADGAADQA